MLLRAALGITATLLGPPQFERDRDVQVLPTPTKGFGVFAMRELPGGTFLARYTGEILSLEDAYAATARGDSSGEYFAELTLGRTGAESFVVDAEDESTSNWPRYINHSQRLANCKNVELRMPLLNSLPVRVPLGLYVKTLRTIAAGEELLVDYGDSYWDRRLGSEGPLDLQQSWKRFVIDNL